MKLSESMEKKRHGSPDFPIGYYSINRSSSRYIMPPHWHNELEIIRITSGRFTIFLNDMEYLLKEDDILFIEGKCLHRGVPEVECTYECIVFDPGILKRQANDSAEPFITDLAGGKKGINCLLERGIDQLYPVVAALFETVKEKAPYYELKVYSLLFNIVFSLYNNGFIIDNSKTPHDHQAEIIADLLDWIEANYSEVITLKSLSQISGLSEKYLCRVFKAYTSKSPISYLNDLRIENACTLITKQNKSITEAAYECGFNDLSYFSKMFKKIKGVTPRKYKNSLGV